jgi:hypothetical protein
LVLKCGDVQFVIEGTSEVVNFSPVSICRECGVDVPLKSGTPIGIVCDYLADNGHFGSVLHELLMLIRDSQN